MSQKQLNSLFPIPVSDLALNTPAFENTPQITPTGFREYDARWLFPTEINLSGIQALGFGLGNVLHELSDNPSLVVGHDYRSYSQSIKLALITGLMTAGAKVYDIGLALSPTAYFAQYELDVPGVAMVTASHNENGWTGVKMGANRPLTFGPDEMTMLRDIVLNGTGVSREGGGYEFVPDMAERYMADLTKEKLKLCWHAVMALPEYLRPKLCRSLILKRLIYIAIRILHSRTTIQTPKIWKCFIL